MRLSVLFSCYKSKNSTQCYTDNGRDNPAHADVKKRQGIAVDFYDTTYSGYFIQTERQSTQHVADGGKQCKYRRAKINIAVITANGVDECQ